MKQQKRKDYIKLVQRSLETQSRGSEFLTTRDYMKRLSDSLLTLKIRKLGEG